VGRIAFIALLIGAFGAVSASAATPDPDGRYRGTHVTRGGQSLGQPISFRVSRDGRRITRLRTTATTFCVGPTLFDNRVFIAPVYVATIRVRANGRFDGELRPQKDSKLEVTGRRRGRRVEGRIDVKIANCSARDDFVARRVGP
jgi:hypothetical protein